MTFPNKTNIDQWLFDYFEGNLSSEQEELLESFLLEHPEYDADMEAMGGARVSSGVDFFPLAEALKREPILSALAIQWAAGIALLIGLAGSVWWLNGTLSNSDYQYVPLALNYFEQMEVDLQNEDSGQTKQANFSANTRSQAEPLVQHNQLNKGRTPNEKEIKPSYGRENSATNVHADYTVSTASSALGKHSSSTATIGEYENTSLPSTGEKYLAWDELSGNNENLEHLDSKPVDVLPSEKDEVTEHKGETIAATNQHAKLKPQLTNNVARSVKNFVNSRLGLVNLRDPQYMVPGQVANTINFGHTGSLLATRVYHSTYAQWPGREGQTFNFITGVDGYVHALRGGLGVQMDYSNYQAGLFQNYTGAITYSPKFRVTKNLVIEPALRFKMGAKQLNADRVFPGQQIEWERGNLKTLYPDGGTPQGERLFYRDFGAGILLNSKWGFAGVNVDNIGRHYDNIYSEDLQNPERSALFLTITAGTDYESYNKKMSLSMYALYQNYGQLNKAWAGVNYRYRFMTIGGSISTRLEPVGSIGVAFDHFKIAYITDYSLNQINGQRMLSHQLTLRFVTKPSKHGHKLLN